ncbi:MAG: hypothetical protein KGM42_01515 [Hyphomicrobiales bacterium]|nr:hypothetical protein [Hyphomicrobiales bacterium]
MSLDPLIVMVATGLLGIVFARALLEKVGNFAVYVATLRDYRLTPARLAPAAAVVLALLEAAALAALLAPGMRPFGAVSAAALLALYALAMALALGAGRTQIECGCGGDGQTISWALVGRNIALIALCGLLFAPVSARSLGVGDFFEAAGAILVGWLLLVGAEKTIENAAAVRRLRSESFL